MRLASTFLLVPRRDARSCIAEEPGWGEICIFSIVLGCLRWLRDLGWVNPMTYLLLPSMVQEVE